MYLYETHEGKDAREFVTTCLPRRGGWPEVKERVERVELWATSLYDDGLDRYELIAYEADGEEIGRKEIPGYQIAGVGHD